MANQLLIEKNLTISQLEDSIRSIMQPITLQLKMSAAATTDLQRVEVTTCNVVAMIPGSDPLLKDEYVVI
ncbi:MAG: aminopeptidase, partial [Bacteroidetes bacterium CG_4_10_14_3_um_filter_42_6]